MFYVWNATLRDRVDLNVNENGKIGPETKANDIKSKFALYSIGMVRGIILES